MDINIQQHKYVPKHTKLKPEEAQELLKKHNISKKQLPRIISKDPIVKLLEANHGDIIKIERKSPTTKKSAYYRVVTNA